MVVVCLGGQRQAVVIARALLKNASLMFLDEPTSAMDENNERRIIQSLKSTSNNTMVIASHKPAVLAICDRILVIEKGEVVAIKTPQTLFGMPRKTLRSVTVKPQNAKKTMAVSKQDDE